jgi:hypothetical protein
MGPSGRLGSVPPVARRADPLEPDAAPAYIIRPIPLFRPSMEPAMRAELQNLADEIAQGLALLRRHLCLG